MTASEKEEEEEVNERERYIHTIDRWRERRPNITRDTGIHEYKSGTKDYTCPGWACGHVLFIDLGNITGLGVEKLSGWLRWLEYHVLDGERDGRRDKHLQQHSLIPGSSREKLLALGFRIVLTLAHLRERERGRERFWSRSTRISDYVYLDLWKSIPQGG